MPTHTPDEVMDILGPIGRKVIPVLAKLLEGKDRIPLSAIETYFTENAESLDVTYEHVLALLDGNFEYCELGKVEDGNLIKSSSFDKIVQRATEEKAHYASMDRSGGGRQRRVYSEV